MKNILTILIVAAMLVSMVGCAATPADTTPSTVPATEVTTEETTEESFEDFTMAAGTADTESAKILTDIWATYAEDDRFFAYGGAMEAPMDNLPGDLDLTLVDEITSRYLLTEDQLASVTEGASLVHGMNSNTFTAAVFALNSDADLQAFADTLKENVMNNQWICGQPDKLVIADMGNNQLLMVFGNGDAIEVFKTNMTTVYADANILYEENIAG